MLSPAFRVSVLPFMDIGGSDMGIIDMNRALNRLGTATPPEAANLGREVLEFEQRNIDSMKSFL